MTKNNRFMLAFEEGHFYGLVDEGEYLRQSLLYKQILPRTPSRPKTSAISDNPVILSISSSCPSCSSWLKNPLNLRNLRLINDLRAYKALYICRDIFTDVVSALQIHLFLQNKAKFRKVKLSVTIEMKKDYDQMDTWSIRKNEPKTNPNEPKTNPILADKTPIRTQFKPKQTQLSPALNSQIYLIYRQRTTNNEQRTNNNQTQFQRQSMLNLTINNRFESKKFHLILVLQRPILSNSGSNCEMDMAATFANDGKRAAGQAAKLTFLDPLETLTRLR